MLDVAVQLLAAYPEENSGGSEIWRVAWWNVSVKKPFPICEDRIRVTDYPDAWEEMEIVGVNLLHQ